MTQDPSLPAVMDNEEEPPIHDQLPTLQEIHHKSLGEIVSYDEKVRLKRRRNLWIMSCTLVLVAMIIVFVVSGSSKKSNEADTIEGYPGSNDTDKKDEDTDDEEKDNSMANSEDREELGLAFLSDVSSSSDLQKTGSSQQLAFEWIIHGDYLQLEIPNSLKDDNTGFVTRYVLALLYYALDGPKWTHGYDFLTGFDACYWNSFEYGILCNQDFEPILVNLPFNNMAGSIPTEIAFLTKLEILSLGGNQIYGTLPSTMQDLKSLRILNMYSNQLTGAIPAWLGYLSNLEWLSLSLNVITGTIPEELGSLSSLRLLGLERCLNINGTIPNALQDLVHLEQIYLGYNQLEGQIPTWIGNFANLTVLGLSNNLFSSYLPPTLSNLGKLTSLYLDDNDLTGDLGVLESLTNLELLLLEDNKFEQYLGSNFLSSLTKLQVLDLSNNKLKGYLSPHLFTMDDLVVLDLHGNEIVGYLPEFPDNNVLEYLSLYENKIYGSTPISISNLKNLTHLDLSSNNFSGVIPGTIGNMESLTYLFLASNNFNEGPIPNSLRNLSNLRELSLKRTSLNGSIPSWIGSLSNLILLDLDDNKLTETIPETLGDLRNLHFLLLNRNTLTGTVPFVLSQLPQLMILLTDNNGISGLGTGVVGSGTVSEFCDRIPYLGGEGSVFTSDCSGAVPELECACCTECCATNFTCNDGSDFLANHDLIWELGYNRMRYVFSNDTVYTRVFN